MHEGWVANYCGMCLSASWSVCHGVNICFHENFLPVSNGLETLIEYASLPRLIMHIQKPRGGGEEANTPPCPLQWSQQSSVETKMNSLVIVKTTKSLMLQVLWPTSHLPRGKDYHQDRRLSANCPHS